MEVRPHRPADRSWVQQRCRLTFGSPGLAVQGRRFRPDRLPGLIACEGGQRRGWDPAAPHRGAAAQDRGLEPGIPATGCGGTALRHYLELELVLAPEEAEA